MPMTLISRQTLTTTAASVTFNNIPQTFQTLKLVMSLRTDFASVSDNVKVSFNGPPSGTTYSERLLYGTGSSALSANQSGISSLTFQYTNGSSATSNTFSNMEITFPNYSLSTNKSIQSDSVTENNSASAIQAMNAGLWSSTSAIISIIIGITSGTGFVANSTFSLYGIS